MPSTFYLRNLTAAAPPTAGEKSSVLPVDPLGANNATGTDETRALRTSKGAAQTSLAKNSDAVKVASDNYLCRFTSDALAAQTIAAATWTIAIAVSEANLAANSFLNLSVYIWRPSTSTVVGFIYDSHASLGVEWAATEDGQVITFSGVAITILGNDVLVLEVWRHAVQGTAAAYAQTVYFNGTTNVVDTTTSDAASYLQNPNIISFLKRGTDSGSGAESQTKRRSFTSTDSGSGAESQTKRRSFTSTDSGSGAESQTKQRSFTSTDSGSGVESHSITVQKESLPRERVPSAITYQLRMRYRSEAHFLLPSYAQVYVEEIHHMSHTSAAEFRAISLTLTSEVLLCVEENWAIIAGICMFDGSRQIHREPLARSCLFFSNAGINDHVVYGPLRRSILQSEEELLLILCGITDQNLASRTAGIQG